MCRKKDVFSLSAKQKISDLGVFICRQDVCFLISKHGENWRFDAKICCDCGLSIGMDPI